MVYVRVCIGVCWCVLVRGGEASMWWCVSEGRGG